MNLIARRRNSPITRSYPVLWTIRNFNCEFSFLIKIWNYSRIGLTRNCELPNITVYNYVNSIDQLYRFFCFHLNIENLKFVFIIEFPFMHLVECVAHWTWCGSCYSPHAKFLTQYLENSSFILSYDILVRANLIVKKANETDKLCVTNAFVLI